MFIYLHVTLTISNDVFTKNRWKYLNFSEKCYFFFNFYYDGISNINIVIFLLYQVSFV